MEQQEKKKFRLFDTQRVGKGVSKQAAKLPPGLKRFWLSYKDNFGKIVSTNIFMVLGNFPIFFLIINLSGYFKIPYFLPSSDLFQNVAGIFAAEGPNNNSRSLSQNDKRSAQDDKLMISYHLVPKTAIFGLPLCLIKGAPFLKRFPKTLKNCTYSIIKKARIIQCALGEISIKF